MQQVQNEAATTYTAVGRREVVEETLFILMPWPVGQDPLAQTFAVSEDRYVTSVGVFFATKDENLSCTVQIRNCVNGYPGNMVLASKTLQPEDVVITDKGNVETKVTFSDPVLVNSNTEYAVVVLTASSQYRLYVAKIGQRDVANNQIVSRQPYNVGVMFSSSNGTAWTAHQEIDMKFKLYGAKFSNEAILAFNQMTVEQATQLVLATTQLVPNGGEVVWEWSSDGQQWFAFQAGKLTNLGASISFIHVRARLRGVSSPVILADGSTLISMSYKDEGIYVSRQIASQSPFEKITVFLDMHTPSGTSQSVEYTIDGTNWIPLGNPVSVSQVDHQFVQNKFVQTLDEPKSSLRVRIKQSTNSGVITPKARRLIVTLS